MLAFERRDNIMLKVKQDKKILVSELSKEFDVSEETIRRDLEKLEKDGAITRTHGGATLNSQTSQDIPYQTRNALNKDLKMNIAKKVASLIQENSTLMVDTSSTVFETINNLKDLDRTITVITNSIDILYYFQSSSLTLISTGGSLRKHSHSLVGTTAEQTLNRYNVDFSIFSCKGLSLKNGIMDSNEPETEIKRTMKERANKVILLVDSTKIDNEAFINVFSIDEIDYLVTDKKPRQEWIDICEDKDITLIY